MSYLSKLHRAHLERRTKFFPPVVSARAADLTEPATIDDADDAPAALSPSVVPDRPMVDSAPISDGARRPSVALCLRAVARQYGVPAGEIKSPMRLAHIVRVRQIFFYITKRLAKRSLPDIGRRTGRRDHTTVLHGIRKIEGILAGADDAAAQLAADIAEIEAKIFDELASAQSVAGAASACDHDQATETETTNG